MTRRRLAASRSRAMCLHVPIQAVFECKLPTADLAFVIAFFLMHAFDMLVQIPTLTKLFPTQVANVISLVKMNKLDVLH